MTCQSNFGGSYGLPATPGLLADSNPGPQPKARRSTDWAMPASFCCKFLLQFSSHRLHPHLRSRWRVQRGDRPGADPGQLDGRSGRYGGARVQPLGGLCGNTWLPLGRRQGNSDCTQTQISRLVWQLSLQFTINNINGLLIIQYPYDSHATNTICQVLLIQVEATCVS